MLEFVKSFTVFWELLGQEAREAAEAIRIDVQQKELAKAEQRLESFWPLNSHSTNQPQILHRHNQHAEGSRCCKKHSSFCRDLHAAFEPCKQYHTLLFTCPWVVQTSTYHGIATWNSHMPPVKAWLAQLTSALEDWQISQQHREGALDEVR